MHTEPVLRAVYRGGRIAEAPARPLPRGPILLGRQPSGARQVLAFPEDSMQSRTHCTLRRDGATLLCVDRNSRNGTWVNGQRITRTALRDGDVLRLGDTLFVLRFVDPDAPDGDVPELVGVAPAMAELRRTLALVGPSRATTVLLGESGSGKGVSARALHRLSGRPGPFVSVNCAALPSDLVESLLFGHVAGAFTGADRDQLGHFRAADSGTLFMDEVGDLPPRLQPKLLHALEDGAVVPVGATRPVDVDVRIVAATSVDLRVAVEEGRFRGDLFARLAEFVVDLPALRDRPDDVLPLLASFLEGASGRLSPDLAEALLVWGWPYNVRELKNAATQLRVRGQAEAQLTVPMVPALSAHLDALRGAVEPRAAEPPDRERLEALLRQHEGVVARVAGALGLSRRHVYRLLDKHGFDPSSFRS